MTGGPAATTAAPPDREEALALYRRMLLIRRFEDSVQSLFQQGHVHGTTHLYSGQEAVATGVCSVLEPQDRVAGTYRGHGHALALGVEPQALLDELLGRETGVCGSCRGGRSIALAHRVLLHLPPRRMRTRKGRGGSWSGPAGVTRTASLAEKPLVAPCAWR